MFPPRNEFRFFGQKQVMCALGIELPTRQFAAGSRRPLGPRGMRMIPSSDAAPAERRGALQSLRQGATLRPLVVGAGLAVLQQCSGINTVVFYCGEIFARWPSGPDPGASLRSDAGDRQAGRASLMVGGPGRYY